MVEEFRARQIEVGQRDAVYWVGRIRAALDASVDPGDTEDRVRRVLEEYRAASAR